jgi:DNA-binding response OmpR family regulator
VVEDAEEIRELVVALLQDAAYDVRSVADGETALAVVADWAPDLVVLDLNLPRLDGVEVCRRLRLMSTAYVLMLTARSDELDRLVGLTIGADDYVTKPFSARELVARVQVLLRRPRLIQGAPVPVPGPGPGAQRAFGPLTLDTEGRDVSVGGIPVPLTRIEYDVLDALTERPGRVLTRDVLRERIWGGGWFADDHAVDVHLSNLRRKLTAAGVTDLITTVRGVGYRTTPQT